MKTNGSDKFYLSRHIFSLIQVCAAWKARINLKSASLIFRSKSGIVVSKPSARLKDRKLSTWDWSNALTRILKVHTLAIYWIEELYITSRIGDASRYIPDHALVIQMGCNFIAVSYRLCIHWQGATTQANLRQHY